MSDQTVEVPDGCTVVTVDIPEDWTPWVNLREGLCVRGQTLVIPEELRQRFQKAQIEWIEVQAEIRQVINSLPNGW